MGGMLVLESGRNSVLEEELGRVAVRGASWSSTTVDLGFVVEVIGVDCPLFVPLAELCFVAAEVIGAAFFAVPFFSAGS